MLSKLTDLDRTVILAYARNNMNTTDAAAELTMHRNSVIYHLDKVGRICPLDPYRFDDLTKLVGLLEGDGAKWRWEGVKIYQCPECKTKFLECDLTHTKCSENLVGSYIDKNCPKCLKRKHIVELKEMVKTDETDPV